MEIITKIYNLDGTIKNHVRHETEEEIRLRQERQLAYEKHMQNQANKTRLEELTKDFAQAIAGFEVPNLETRKAEFRELLNKVREYEGKEPRKEIQELEGD